MPVYEVQYRAWEGEVMPTWRKLLAIPKFTLMSVFNKWLAVSLFGIGSLQLLAWSGYIILSSNPLVRQLFNFNNQLPILDPHDVMRRFLLLQTFIAIFSVATAAAPKMISQEIAHRALPLLYSRPLSRLSYIAGKVAGLGALVSYLTWVQALVLFIVMFVNYESTSHFHESFWTYALPMLGRVLIAGVLASILISLVALACSAATKSNRFAVVLFLLLIFGTSFISALVKRSFHAEFPDLGMRELLYSATERLLSMDIEVAEERWQSIVANHLKMGSRVLFGQTYPVSTRNIIVGLLLWGGGAIGFMLWKLRPVDVYRE